MGFINLLNEELGNENRKGIIVGTTNRASDSDDESFEQGGLTKILNL